MMVFGLRARRGKSLQVGGDLDSNGYRQGNGYSLPISAKDRVGIFFTGKVFSMVKLQLGSIHIQLLCIYWCKPIRQQAH